MDDELTMLCWLGRDEDGSLFLYFRDCPNKQEIAGIWHNISGECILLVSELFPEVKWEDEQPTEVEMNFNITSINKK